MQLEFFFLPRPWLGVDPTLVTNNESIGHDDDDGASRRCQFLFRANDESVYVKGSIAQRDHETIWLPYWHQVVINTETCMRSIRTVAFLD